MLLVRCICSICDLCGEFNAPLYAHVCAWSGAFVVHGLGWTDDLDLKFGDDVGVLQCKTVFDLSSDIASNVFAGCYWFCRPYCWTKLPKTCGGTLHKTLKWLVTCIQNKRKLPNLTLYNASQIIKKVVLSLFQTNKVLHYIKFAWFVAT